jgi:hypothetical protein
LKNPLGNLPFISCQATERLLACHLKQYGSFLPMQINTKIHRLFFFYLLGKVYLFKRRAGSVAQSYLLCYTEERKEKKGKKGKKRRRML